MIQKLNSNLTAGSWKSKLMQWLSLKWTNDVNKFSQEILKCLKPKSVWIVNAIVPCSTIIILGKMLMGKTARICQQREKYFLGQSPYLNQCSLLLCSFHFWSLKRIIRNEWNKITTFLTRNFTNKVNQVRKFNKLLTLLYSSIPLF